MYKALDKAIKCMDGNIDSKLIQKVPSKFRNRIFSLEYEPRSAGGSKYRIQLAGKWVHFEGSQVFRADNFSEILYAIKTAEEE